MTPRPIVWQFTIKDFVTYTGFLLTMAGGYFGIINKIDSNQLKTDAKFELVNYRLNGLEKSNNSYVYEHPKEAILPQSPRFKNRNLLLDIQ